MVSLLRTGGKPPESHLLGGQEDGIFSNLQFYLTFLRKYWIIKVASWSEVKPTPS